MTRQSHDESGGCRRFLEKCKALRPRSAIALPAPHPASCCDLYLCAVTQHTHPHVCHHPTPAPACRAYPVAQSGRQAVCASGSGRPVAFGSQQISNCTRHQRARSPRSTSSGRHRARCRPPLRQRFSEPCDEPRVSLGPTVGAVGG